MVRARPVRQRINTSAYRARRLELAERQRAAGWITYHMLGPLTQSDVRYLRFAFRRDGPRSVLYVWYGRVALEVAWSEYKRLLRLDMNRDSR